MRARKTSRGCPTSRRIRNCASASRRNSSAALTRLEGTIDDASMRKMNAAAELDGKDFATVAAIFLAQRAGAPVSAAAPGAKSGGFDDFWRKLFGPDFVRLTLEQLGLVFL